MVELFFFFLKELDIVRVQARLYKIDVHKNFQTSTTSLSQFISIKLCTKRPFRTVVNVAPNTWFEIAGTLASLEENWST